MELDGRMDRGEERSVEPATALGDEFGDLVWHVSHCVGGFDVVEDPLATSFRDEFPAEDLRGVSEGRIARPDGGRGTYSILGEVHVRGEDVCPGTML